MAKIMICRDITKQNVKKLFKFYGKIILKSITNKI